MLLSQVWWPPICMDLIVWVSLLALSAVVPLLGWRPKALKQRGVDAGTQSCLSLESEAPDGHDARARWGLRAAPRSASGRVVVPTHMSSRGEPMYSVVLPRVNSIFSRRVQSRLAFVCDG